MTTIKCVESYRDLDKNLYGCFLIEPLEMGNGITIGNALRRTLLSDLTSFAISGLRVNKVQHEFSIIEGVKEDVFEVISNLKEIVFQSSYFPYSSQIETYKGFMRVRGPIVITAGMFLLPRNKLKIFNPHQYICTLTESLPFSLEIDLENGKNDELMEENNKRTLLSDSFFLNQPNTIVLNTLFSPIKNTNYKIKLIHDTNGNLKESLSFEILTNGSLTPERSLQEAIKNILTLFAPLLITDDFKLISESLNKKTQKLENFFKVLSKI